MISKKPVRYFEYDENNKRRYHIEFDYRSAIDRAFLCNQIGAVNLLIAHVVKYQNKFSFANLFIHNVTALMLAGINMTELINSNIFVFRFQYNEFEWPSMHTRQDYCIIPYNDSPTDLRYKYKEMFDYLDYKMPESKEYCCNISYRIKYTLNMLPSIMKDIKTNKSFITAIKDYGLQDLSIFDSPHIQHIIKFSWKAYVGTHHYIAAFMFMFQVITLVVYVYFTYLSGEYGAHPNKLVPPLLIVGLVFQILYELR